MLTSELDFHLPPELIAQSPVFERTASRLLHYRRADGKVSHRRFSDLPGLLHAGDVLVFNDARVIPARIMLRKLTGGRIEGLFLSELAPWTWRVLLRDVGRSKPGLELCFLADPSVTVTLGERLVEGEYVLNVHSTEPTPVLLARLGRMPLPPYIKRDKDVDARDEQDKERYQTIYAQAPGSVAAPTAGLHFSEPLLARLDALGIERATVTLHVGTGTFKPVTVDHLASHPMHAEAYTISPAASETLTRARRDGRRVVAVGTTTARVLESQSSGDVIEAGAGETSLLISPGYMWKHVGALITNFHLPRSTLSVLVAGLIGLDEQKRVYQEAIHERYRFFSYGDAMFVE